LNDNLLKLFENLFLFFSSNERLVLSDEFGDKLKEFAGVFDKTSVIVM
jgi:hypothetical protein